MERIPLQVLFFEVEFRGLGTFIIQLMLTYSFLQNGK